MAKYIKYLTRLEDGELEFVTERDEERPIVYENDEAYYIYVEELDMKYGYPKKFEGESFIIKEEEEKWKIKL